jgi:hypothetical protein
LPRKRATACTSPGKRVRSVLGPARYQVTSTPWRTCYTILNKFCGIETNLLPVSGIKSRPSNP